MMDNDIIVRIIELVVTVIVALIGRYAIPYVKAKVGEKKFDQIVEWAFVFVSAAEKTIGGEGTGADKRELVMRQITEKAKDLGITLTEEHVRAILESALAELKADGVIVTNV